MITFSSMIGPKFVLIALMLVLLSILAPAAEAVCDDACIGDCVTPYWDMPEDIRCVGCKACR